MENTEMYALIGKDNNMWGFYYTYDEADKNRLKQSDPEWYRIKPVPESLVNKLLKIYE